MTTVQANLAPGCSASPAPGDRSEVPGHLRLQLPLLPRFLLQPTHGGREGRRGERDILSWPKSHRFSPEKLCPRRAAPESLELLASLLWALPTRVLTGLSLRVGLVVVQARWPGGVGSCSHPPTDGLAHPSPKVRVLSGNGLISSVGGLEGSH